MNAYISLSYLDLVGAAVFLVLNAAFSLMLRLNLERQLLVASLRMIVQLLMVGLVLKAVFAASSPWITLVLAICMIIFAGREIWARQERRLAGIWGYSLGGVSMMIAGTIVAVFALVLQIEPDRKSVV